MPDIHEAAEFHLIAERRVAENALAYAAVGADVDPIADANAAEMRKEQTVALTVLVVGESDPADHRAGTDAAVRPHHGTRVNDRAGTDPRPRADAHAVADGRARGDLRARVHGGSGRDADRRFRRPPGRRQQRFHGTDEPCPRVRDRNQRLRRRRVEVGVRCDDDDRR